MGRKPPKQRSDKGTKRPVGEITVSSDKIRIDGRKSGLRGSQKNPSGPRGQQVHPYRDTQILEIVNWFYNALTNPSFSFEEYFALDLLGRIIISLDYMKSPPQFSKGCLCYRIMNACYPIRECVECGSIENLDTHHITGHYVHHGQGRYLWIVYLCSGRNGGNNCHIRAQNELRNGINDLAKKYYAFVLQHPLPEDAPNIDIKATRNKTFDEILGVSEPLY